MKLNLGCGDDQREEWVNVDVDESCDPDLVYNLEETPWPYSDGSAERILMDNVIEHIRPDKRTRVIEELHRVLDIDGVLIVRTPVPPYGGGWDETHWSVPTWEWPEHPRWRDRWRVLDVSGSPVGPGRFLPDPLGMLFTKYGVIRCFDEIEVKVAREGSSLW